MEKVARILSVFRIIPSTTARVVPASTINELAYKFPYYFTGTTEYGEAVYLVEFGKWDTRSVLSAGCSLELLDEFYTEFFTNMIQDGLSAGCNGSVLILDTKGLDASQSEDVTVRQFFKCQLFKFEKLNKDKGVKLVYVVNANKATLDIYEASKPTLNGTGELFKVYTENVTSWCPDLLSYLNLDLKIRNELSVLSPLQVLLDEEFCPDLRSKFPYHLSGYTAAGSPIFIMPVGKYDYKSAIDKGPHSAQRLSRLMSQMFLRLYTLGLKSPGGRGAILIADAKGLSPTQIDTPYVRKHMLHDFAIMDKINSGPGLNKIYVINAPPTEYREFLVDVEPLASNTRKKIRIFYEDQDYRAELREEVKAPIPEEYGGTSDYAPLVCY